MPHYSKEVYIRIGMHNAYLGTHVAESHKIKGSSDSYHSILLTTTAGLDKVRNIDDIQFTDINDAAILASIDSYSRIYIIVHGSQQSRSQVITDDDTTVPLVTLAKFLGNKMTHASLHQETQHKCRISMLTCYSGNGVSISSGTIAGLFHFAMFRQQHIFCDVLGRSGVVLTFASSYKLPQYIYKHVRMKRSQSSYFSAGEGYKITYSNKGESLIYYDERQPSAFQMVKFDIIPKLQTCKIATHNAAKKHKLADYISEIRSVLSQIKDDDVDRTECESTAMRYKTELGSWKQHQAQLQQLKLILERMSDDPILRIAGSGWRGKIYKGSNTLTTILKIKDSLDGLGTIQ